MVIKRLTSKDVFIMFLSKSRVICTVFILILLVIITDINAQSNEFNYDESKVPKYKLPDPLILQDGNKVVNKEIWIKERRPEIFHLFEQQMFGKSPDKPDKLSFKITAIDNKALNGKRFARKLPFILWTKRIMPKCKCLSTCPIINKRSTLCL